jgi:hypothetical protein
MLCAVAGIFGTTVRLRRAARVAELLAMAFFAVERDDADFAVCVELFVVRGAGLAGAFAAVDAAEGFFFFTVVLCAQSGRVQNRSRDAATRQRRNGRFEDNMVLTFFTLSARLLCKPLTKR